MTVETIALIEKQIRFDLSPEQVSGWLKKAHGFALVMNVFISIYGQINVIVVTYTLICVKSRQEEA